MQLKSKLCDFLPDCHIFEYVMVNTAVCNAKSAACIDQDCFY